MELTLKERKQAINKITLWGVLVNFILSVTKIFGGILGHSAALLADGIHSLSDLASDAMVLFAAKHAGEEADDDHPYGHGRFETLATVGLGVLLVFVGLGIAYDAVTRLLSEITPVIPHILTLWIAGLSIISKEILFHYTKNVGLRIRSELLKANAWHHRSDAISSVIVFIGITGAMFGFPTLDAYAAVIVSIMIMKIGSDLAYHSLQQLVDTGLEPELVNKIKEQILRHEDVLQLHLLRSRRMGHTALVDVHIQVAPKLSVSEGHHISEAVENSLKNRFEEINDVTVHIDPEDDEQEASSMGLPLRSELIIALNQEWAKDENLKYINDVTLHYLGGKIFVEACLPIKNIGSLENARRLQETFTAACAKVENIGFSELRFH